MGLDVWHLHGDGVDSRALVRRVLSRYAPVAPSEWVFGSGPHGRPEVTTPACALRFSVAHTRGMTLVGVCDDGEIGVDVERLDRREPPGLAQRWFAPAEIAALAAVDGPARARRFLELWTLKEAYAKARGLGVLGLPLAGFTIDVAAAPPALRAATDDDAARWRLTLVSLGEHLVAVATTTSRAPAFHNAAQVLAGDEIEIA